MPGSIDVAHRSGLEVIATTTGWTGLAAVVCGMVTALGWGLWRCRRAAPGDQARAAVWAVVAAVAGCALLSPGALAVPSTAVVFALAWGMMPSLMTHRAGRLHGGLVIVAFATALAVLGLERVGSLWLDPTSVADRHGNFAAGFLLTALLLWQFCRRRWWLAGLCGLIGGGATAAGEIAQKFVTTRGASLADAHWDFTGASVALIAFLGVRALLWFESHRYRTRPDFRKYRQYAEA